MTSLFNMGELCFYYTIEKNFILVFSLNIWSEVNQFVHAYLFHSKASTGRNVSRFSLNPNCLVKICPFYIIQCIDWTYHICLYIQEDRKIRPTEWLWERERLLFGCWLGREWTLSRGIHSLTAVGWGDLKFLPNWWNKKEKIIMVFN